MISWLKGEIVHKWKTSTKKGLVLNVGGIGYEIQLLPKHLEEVEVFNEIELWIHQIDREDGTSLYGFIEVNQRDLFREIISVNGIGPQIGIAMLEDFEVAQLVNAIENKESNLLTKTQGIGKRIAERLIVELRNKLQRFIISCAMDDYVICNLCDGVSGVGMAAIAGIDHRHRRGDVFGNKMGRAAGFVAHHKHVAVHGLQIPQHVHQGFALGGGGGADVDVEYIGG